MNVTFINRMMGIARGGGETFDLNMAAALEKLGVNVRFVVGRRLFGLDEALDEFDTHYITTPYLRSVDYRLCNSRYRPLRSIGYRSRLLDDQMFAVATEKYLRNDSQTDIHQICALSSLGAKLAFLGKKAVIRWPGPPGRKRAEFANCCSGSFSHGKSYEDARKFSPDIRYITAGCDIELFRPEQKQNEATGKCRFVFVGRCIAIKNLEFLIDGFAEAKRQRPEISLCIVGDGTSQPKLKEKIEKDDLVGGVEFAGTQTGENLAQFYRQSDCFVLVSNYESFGIVVLEAMSSGLPVILSNVGNLPSFVDKYQAGTLVEPDNKAELAKAMIWYADNPQERIRVGSSNRATVEKEFSWDSNAKKLLELYESILK